jgi:hypothetical protein
MAEHYTTNTLEATKFCNHCGRNTQHAVSCGRIGRCLEHAAPQYSAAQLRRRERLVREAERDRIPRLF